MSKTNNEAKISMLLMSTEDMKAQIGMIQISIKDMQTTIGKIFHEIEEEETIIDIPDADIYDIIENYIELIICKTKNLKEAKISAFKIYKETHNICKRKNYIIKEIKVTENINIENNYKIVTYNPLYKKIFEKILWNY